MTRDLRFSKALSLNLFGLITLCAISLSLGACGKKDANSPANPESALSGDAPASPTLQSLQPLPAQSSQRSYQFIANDCDTGKHVAFGKDPQEATQKACAMLQDSALNHGCALELRQNFFAKNCAGVFAPELENLAIENYRLNPTLKGREATVAKEFMEDMRAHGLNAGGPLGATYITQRTQLYEGSNPNLYLGVLTIPELGMPLMLQFDLDPARKDPPRLRVVVKKCDPTGLTTLPEILADPKCILEIANAQLKAGAK